ncbi:MAG: hypothetical protein DRJ37_01300 [Thermoprotei archaeon]|nr:MAG: hypothetical protein DRJ37_01300 [Thermoprotei archaeon]
MSPISRRRFLEIGFTLALVGALGASVKFMPRPRLVRPPGALVEEEFLSKCIRCGLCVENCLTGTLSPAPLSMGLAVWGTPRIDPLKAPCEAVKGRCENVLPCVRACPTEALVFVDSKFIKLGTVVWIRENCLPVKYKLECLVCQEVCPVGAVDNKGMIPVFRKEKCVGCGKCVYACPAIPKALYLSPIGERRVATTR